MLKGIVVWVVFQEDSDGCDDFEVRQASSGDSDDTDEEEMVEVVEGSNTLYFHNKDGMGKFLFKHNYGLVQFFDRRKRNLWP